MGDGFVAGMVKESFPVVGNLMEMKDTISDFKQKGVVNSGIRATLNLVPNGPWTLWLEGLTRMKTGKGWEETIADAVTGQGKEKPVDAKEVELSDKEQETVLKLAEKSTGKLNNMDKTSKRINDSLKELEKIKDPEKQAAAKDAYFSLVQMKVMDEIAKDGKVTSKEEELAARVGQQMKDAGYAPLPENTEAGLQRPGGSGPKIA